MGEPVMSQQVNILDDLKTAAVLGGCTGVLGAVTVPFLLPSALELAPPDQRSLPLPLPLFCLILAIQSVVVYGSFALAGLRLARARHHEPTPILSAVWKKEGLPRLAFPVGSAFATGLVCGLALVGIVTLI